MSDWMSKGSKKNSKFILYVLCFNHDGKNPQISPSFVTIQSDELQSNSGVNVTLSKIHIDVRTPREL